MINKLFPNKPLAAFAPPLDDPQFPQVVFDRPPTNPMSFGNDFNLIRAVAEHGPLRVEQINKRLAQITAEVEDLEVERRTLEQLIAIVS